MLTTVLAFLVALGVLITFHELGHYWAARRCGVRVLRFSVGFGRPIWMRTDRHGTEWAIAAIPLGGYVKMLDKAEDGEANQAGEAFNDQSVWRRFFIVVAGPVANFILAMFIYTGLNVAGTEEPRAIVAQPAVGTPAAQAHILQNDEIVAVNGEPVASWPQAAWRLMDHIFSGDVVTLDVATNARVTQRTLNLDGIAQQASSLEQDPLQLAGLALAPGRVELGQIMPDSAAQRAGLQAEDTIISVGPIQEPDVLAFIAHIEAHPETPVAIGVRRDNTNLMIHATPMLSQTADGNEVGRLGVGITRVVPMVTVRHGVLDSLWRSTGRTFETAWFSLKMLGKMVTGNVSLRNLSGPVTIADHAGKSARMGLVVYLNFVALVSISIGVLNLLPIPLLDGGHLAFYTLEIIRGKPVPDQWISIGQRAGAAVLAGLMSVALLNDLMRLLN